MNAESESQVFVSVLPLCIRSWSRGIDSVLGSFVNSPVSLEGLRFILFIKYSVVVTIILHHSINSFDIYESGGVRSRDGVGFCGLGLAQRAEVQRCRGFSS